MKLLVLAVVWNLAVPQSTEEPWPINAETACLARIFDQQTGKAFKKFHFELVRLDRCGNWSRLVTTDSEGRQEVVTGLYEALEKARAGGVPFTRACEQAEQETRSVRTVPSARLAPLLDELRNLKISPVIDSDLIPHGDFFDLRVTSGAGSARYEFYAAQPTNEADSLRNWVYSLATTVPTECKR